MKLSENFFLQEFRAQDSILHHVSNYRALCYFALEPIRKEFGGPVVITSGYRDPEYNKAIGGSPTSQHIFGEACDFLIKGVDSKKIYEFVCEKLDFPGQVFFYAKRRHLHLGLPRLGLAPTRKIMEVEG